MNRRLVLAVLLILLLLGLALATVVSGQEQTVLIQRAEQGLLLHVVAYADGWPAITTNSGVIPIVAAVEDEATGEQRMTIRVALMCGDALLVDGQVVVQAHCALQPVVRK